MAKKKSKINSNYLILGALLVAVIFLAPNMFALVTEQSVPLRTSSQSYPTSLSWTTHSVSFDRDTGANIIPSGATITPGTYTLYIDFSAIKHTTIRDCNGNLLWDVTWDGGAERLQFPIPSSCIGSDMTVKFTADSPGSSNFNVLSAEFDYLQYDDGTPVGCVASECTALDGWTNWKNVGCSDGKMNQVRYYKTHYCEGTVCYYHDSPYTDTEERRVLDSSCVIDNEADTCTSTCNRAEDTQCSSGKVKICRDHNGDGCLTWKTFTCDAPATCPSGKNNCGIYTTDSGGDTGGGDTGGGDTGGGDTGGGDTGGDTKTTCWQCVEHKGPSSKVVDGNTCPSGWKTSKITTSTCPIEKKCTYDFIDSRYVGIDDDCPDEYICDDESAGYETKVEAEKECDTFTASKGDAKDTCENIWEDADNDCEPNYMWIGIGALFVILLFVMVTNMGGGRQQQASAYGVLPY